MLKHVCLRRLFGGPELKFYILEVYLKSKEYANNHWMTNDEC